MEYIDILVFFSRFILRLQVENLFVCNNFYRGYRYGPRLEV